MKEQIDKCTRCPHEFTIADKMSNKIFYTDTGRVCQVCNGLTARIEKQRGLK